MLVYFYKKINKEKKKLNGKGMKNEQERKNMSNQNKALKLTLRESSLFK